MTVEKEVKPKRKLKPGMGKAKGSGFEGAVAKKFSTALAPLKFIRTQGSGARVGGKNFETLGQMFGEEALKLFVGDVVPVNEKEAGVTWLHSVECKFYKTQDPFTSLVSGTANIFKWMDESVTDAIKINKIPLLVFKWNNTPIFVAIRDADLGAMSVRSLLDGKAQYTPAVKIANEKMAMSIFYLDELLKCSSFWVDSRV